MSNPKRFIIWGSAGHAKVLGSLIALNGGQVVALFDNNPYASSSLNGVPLFFGQKGFEHWIANNHSSGDLYGLAAIGGNHGRDRLDIQKLLNNHKVQTPWLQHPDASVCRTAKIGMGTQILAQSVVASDAKIGEACIINHQGSVDHECCLGDGVHIAPGATICGCVTLSDNVMIGAGAVILPRLKIGEDTIVGAGAVVTHDLPSRVVAFGNPARVIRNI